MFPCIQPGDVLQIESRRIEQVQVGDIAVFRRNNALLGHRIIAKGTRAGNPYIVTRPDRTKQGDDGPTSSEDVLGVVAVVERRGTHMPLYPQPLRGIMALRMAVWEWWNGNPRACLIERILTMQRRPWYRSIASVWFKIVKPRLSFGVRVPLTANQSHDLYHEISPSTFDSSQTSWHGKPVTRWLLVLYLNGGKTPAASATINWHPAGCPHGAGWSVDEVQTRLRYGGAGMDAVLIKQAEAVLARNEIVLQRVPE